MRGAVEAAQESAAEALDSLALEQRLAPVRKGAGCCGRSPGACAKSAMTGESAT